MNRQGETVAPLIVALARDGRNPRLAAGGSNQSYDCLDRLKYGGVLMATILIIEDDRETNDAICEYLKSAGHRAFTAYDGGEA